MAPPTAPRKNKGVLTRKVKFLARGAKNIKNRMKTSAALGKGDMRDDEKFHAAVPELTATEKSTVDEDDPAMSPQECASKHPTKEIHQDDARCKIRGAPKRDNYHNMFTPIVVRKRASTLEHREANSRTALEEGKAIFDSAAASDDSTKYLTPKRPDNHEVREKNADVALFEEENGCISASLGGPSNYAPHDRVMKPASLQINYQMDAKEGNRTRISYVRFKDDDVTSDEDDGGESFEGEDAQEDQCEVAKESDASSIKAQESDHAQNQAKPKENSDSNTQTSCTLSSAKETKHLVPENKANAVISGSYTIHIDHRDTYYGHINQQQDRACNSPKDDRGRAKNEVDVNWQASDKTPLSCLSTTPTEDGHAPQSIMDSGVRSSGATRSYDSRNEVIVSSQSCSSTSVETSRSLQSAMDAELSLTRGIGRSQKQSCLKQSTVASEAALTVGGRQSRTSSTTLTSRMMREENDNESDRLSSTRAIIDGRNQSTTEHDASLAGLGPSVLSPFTATVKGKLQDCIAPQHQSPSPIKRVTSTCREKLSVSIGNRFKDCLAPQLQPLSPDAEIARDIEAMRRWRGTSRDIAARRNLE